jgi:hypothetical protein
LGIGYDQVHLSVGAGGDFAVDARPGDLDICAAALGLMDHAAGLIDHAALLSSTR